MKKISVCIPVAITIVLLACACGPCKTCLPCPVCPSTPCPVDCDVEYKFEVYQTGDQFLVANNDQLGAEYPQRPIFLEQYTTISGNIITDGVVVVDNQGMAGGSGKDILLTNAKLRFEFDKANLVRFYLGMQDGEFYLEFNGMPFKFSNIFDLQNLNGQTFNNVNVTVTSIDKYKVIVQLVGPMDKAIYMGGANLWLDNICIK